MNSSNHSGGCLCGAIRYQVGGKALFLCYCHCESCRRAAGGTVVAWGTFLRSDFVVTHGQLTEFASSRSVLRGFCATCGTSLTYRRDGRAAEIDVTLASLDAPTLLKPECHIWVRDKLPWVAMDDGLPQFETVSTS
ncbi:MAG: GFA family protein [Pseudomonadota bacterium]|nr:GFA family protein [Pseudomonadota bacterium]